VAFVKYSSVNSLSEKTLVLIENGQLDKALRTIHDFVERIITEPLCTAQVFGSKVLDDLCQQIGQANLKNVKQQNLIDSPRPILSQEQPTIIYLVTKLQRSGGHTRVIEDFIKSKPLAKHIILSTELDGASDLDYVNQICLNNNITFEKSHRINYIQRLTWLQQHLIAYQPSEVFLFNHHQDSIAVAAIQPSMQFNATFYHHGDHHLCLGVYLPYFKHIDPHPMGYHNCRNVLHIENTYVPLTTDDKGDRPESLRFFSNETLTTCTAARSNKVEVPYFVSYLELIPRILKTTQGKHVHIGRLTPWALYKIKKQLKKNGVHQDRFIYIEWVPSVWKTLHEYQVDLYIASFPYGGGLTLVEAMGAGIPVALHKHMYSKFLSCIELGYPNAFNWRFPQELINYCKSLTAEELQKASRSARLQYEKFHSTSLNQNDLDLIPFHKKSSFTIESDEWGFWMERQLTLKRVILRTMYRTFKRYRAFLS